MPSLLARKQFKIVFAVVLVMGTFFVRWKTAHADLLVPDGLITTNVTWAAADSPIIVNSFVGLGPNGVLRIEPGVEIRLGPNAEITSGAGSIVALGTESEPIVFTSLDDSPSLAWDKVQLGSDLDQLSYVEFRYGTQCLDLNNNIIVSNIKIHDCSVGIFIRPGFAGTIENSEISASTYGIRVTGNSNLTIKNNRIHNNFNGGAGIYIDSNLVMHVNNNDIFDNYDGFGADNTQATFTENNIYLNTNAGFENFGSLTPTMDDNWWGDSTGPLQISLNPGGLGDKIIGNANFDPWANVIFDNAPVASTPAPPPTATPPPAPDPDPVPPPPARPGPEPTSLRPVIIIPGIMGSELYDGPDLIWPNVEKLKTEFLFPHGFLSDHLSLDNQGVSLNKVAIGNIVKKIDINILGINKKLTDTFDGLIANLSGAGYVLNQNLFVFPYDWRLDLDTDRDQLAQKIQNIQNQTGFQKINIIAHSMGGLVVEDYIKEYGTQTIDHLIFVGTPHLGAPKAADILLSGNLGEPMSYFVDPSQIKAIALNSPSIYELLPNKKYFDLYQGYVKTMPLGEELDYFGTKDLLSALGKNTLLINRAQSFFDKHLEDTNYGNIHVSNIVGCKIASTNDYYTVNQSNRTIAGIQYSSGDETVPYVSAAYSQGTEYYVIGAKHADLPSADGVKELITSLLVGQETLSAGISTNTSSCGLNGKELNFRSPVSVQIYDSLNNHSGPMDDGTIENNIPGATYEMIDGEAYIFLPTDEGQNYKIQGTGTATGAFDLIITDINNDQVTNNTLFNDIQIIPGSAISFTVSESSDDSQIGFDFYNNGKNVNLSASNQFPDQSQALLQAISPPAVSDSNKQYDSGKILGKMTDKLPDGTLALDSMDNRTVYMIGGNGKKYGFTSEKAFRGLGFRFNQVLVKDLSDYKLGGLVSDPKEIHPNGSLVIDGQTVWFINNEKRFGFASIEQFKSYGFDLKQIVLANKNDMFLGETNLLIK